MRSAPHQPHQSGDRSASCPANQHTPRPKPFWSQSGLSGHHAHQAFMKRARMGANL